MLRIQFVSTEACLVCECSKCSHANRFAVGTALAHPVACQHCGHQADIARAALEAMHLPPDLAANRHQVPRPARADDGAPDPRA